MIPEPPFHAWPSCAKSFSIEHVSPAKTHPSRRRKPLRPTPVPGPRQSVSCSRYRNHADDLSNKQSLVSGSRQSPSITCQRLSLNSKFAMMIIRRSMVSTFQFRSLSLSLGYSARSRLPPPCSPLASSSGKLRANGGKQRRVGRAKKAVDDDGEDDDDDGEKRLGTSCWSLLDRH